MSQYDQFAADVWNGDKSTLAALHDMTPQDLRGIEKAIFGKYGFNIDLNMSAAEVQAAVAKVRAPSGQREATTRLDRALREANAEDS
jgi:hypothetical protein